MTDSVASAPAPPPKRAYISFCAEIVPSTTENLIALAANLVNGGFNELYVLFSTPGGSVMNGLTLYNVLRAFPVKLTMHNVGNVDSIGNAIFLAGAERYACPHSTFMFHGVGIDLPPGYRLEQKNSEENLGLILSDQKRIGSVVKDRTNLNDAEIGDLFKEARTKDAAWAKGVGFVNDICDVAIAPGAPVHSLVFPRQPIGR